MLLAILRIKIPISMLCFECVYICARTPSSPDSASLGNACCSLRLCFFHDRQCAPDRRCSVRPAGRRPHALLFITLNASLLASGCSGPATSQSTELGRVAFALVLHKQVKLQSSEASGAQHPCTVARSVRGSRPHKLSNALSTSASFSRSSAKVFWFFSRTFSGALPDLSMPCRRASILAMFSSRAARC